MPKKSIQKVKKAELFVKPINSNQDSETTKRDIQQNTNLTKLKIAKAPIQDKKIAML